MDVTLGPNWPPDSCQMPTPVVMTLKLAELREGIVAPVQEGVGRYRIKSLLPSLQFHESISENLSEPKVGRPNTMTANQGMTLFYSSLKQCFLQ